MSEESKARYKKWYENNKENARKMKREKMRKYRAKDPEKYAKQSRDAKKRLKDKLFEMYGEECCICGFTDKRALTLDHVKNNGNKERRELGVRGVYQRARNNYLPKAYLVHELSIYREGELCKIELTKQWLQSHSLFCQRG